MRKKGQQRFSDYFQLNRRQAELDFVDVPVATDLGLYVDPYALQISPQDWLRECGNNVVAYFELLVDKIRSGDERSVLQLLDNFHEPNETHLGQSSGTPNGRGWGPKQARQLLNILRSSAVVRTGSLNDLGDYELFIPGIGPDKISDLATNIIKSDLLLYTQEQCELWDIPTNSVNSGKCWEVGTGEFRSRYVNLPLCNGAPIILVPKTAVRTRLLADRDKFYSTLVLDYLEAELITANDSLVTVLKNGKRKVYRSDLRERYPFSRQDLYDFAKQHPDIYKRYKDSLPAQAKPIENINIEWVQQERRPADVEDLDDRLARVAPGRTEAGQYHSLVLGALQSIFYPQLTRPKREKEVDEGRKRIDIEFTNSADKGFFSRLVNFHRVFAPFIAVECKNYQEDPANPEIDQLLGRLGKKRGNFGILFCRNVDNPELMLKRCRDTLNRSENILLVLDDEDLLNLWRLRRDQRQIDLDDYMTEKLDAVLS